MSFRQMRFVLCLSGIVLLYGCKETPKSFRSNPLHQLKTYSFDPGSPLDSRIKKCPDFLLAYLKKLDHRKDYEAYSLTAAEKAVMREYLASLPPGLKKVMRDRLVGIYFVRNFLGNGLGDWLLDDKDNIYAYIVLNPAGFKKTLSETLTERERSAFNGETGIKVDCGKRYTGVLYSLLHETAHVYDFVKKVTPYTEERFVFVLRNGKGLEAAWDVWRDLLHPETAADFPLRNKLSFYGSRGVPSISAGEAAKVYGGFEKSPFASLYGSWSWAEDVAELIVFYHLTRALGQPYEITVPAGGGKYVKIRPMERGSVLKRAEGIYLSGGG